MQDKHFTCCTITLTLSVLKHIENKYRKERKDQENTAVVCTLWFEHVAHFPQDWHPEGSQTHQEGCTSKDRHPWAESALRWRGAGQRVKVPTHYRGDYVPTMGRKLRERARSLKEDAGERLGGEKTGILTCVTSTLFFPL